uniref:Endonuclease/exonuclease/phosphatase domain-containing protein n=1 Tax=Sphaeramia orbicularis TaxID=375764 RepID=A0A672Y4V7_9TELE
MWTKGKCIISIGEDKADGVGIFFRTHDIVIIRRRDIIPGRLLMIDCLYQGDKYRIINVYTAPEARKKTKLFKRLRELLMVGYKVILSGDFNTVTAENDRYSTAPFRLTTEGKHLKLINEEAKLIDTCRSINPFGLEFTR